ncbi:MAG: hypothetical protein WA913_06630, partial [Pricia sp.]
METTHKPLALSHYNISGTLLDTILQKSDDEIFHFAPINDKKGNITDFTLIYTNLRDSDAAPNHFPPGSLFSHIYADI